LRAAGTDRTFDGIVRQIRGIRVHRRQLLAFSLVIAVAAGVCLQAQAMTFTVTTMQDGGSGSLRDAITQANADTTTTGPDTVAFAIPPGGVPTIALASVLPAIARPVIIDGTTQQPGGMVQISGGGTVDGGLLLSGGNSTVTGLVLNGFVTYGIQLASAGGNVVSGCIVGLDPTGTVKAGADMVRGIWVNGSPGNIIGGRPKARATCSPATPTASPSRPPGPPATRCRAT
jgi:hypothetical protein